MNLQLFLDILNAAGPVGISAIFGWMWWLERKDRKAADKQLYDLATASIETTTKTEIAVTTLARLLGASHDLRRRDAQEIAGP